LCKAAVAYAAKEPMRIENIWVAAPKEGEIRIKVISNALCHTDVYRLDGCDP
jgi:S-(hydroxymethyl)glutathione dehydrogenase/alcohol dehydrogenase